MPCCYCSQKMFNNVMLLLFTLDVLFNNAMLLLFTEDVQLHVDAGGDSG